MNEHTLESLKELFDVFLYYYMDNYSTFLKQPDDDDDVPVLLIGHHPKDGDVAYRVMVAEEQEQGYHVYKTKLIPGCWTLSNGDPGYPDEYDEVLVKYSSIDAFPDKQAVVQRIIEDLVSEHLRCDLDECRLLDGQREESESSDEN
jgi:hypothetical protein